MPLMSIPPMPDMPPEVLDRAVEVGEDLVGGAAGAVEPVVEDDDPLLVVVPRLGRVVDHQDAVQAAVELDADVRVVEVGARIGTVNGTRTPPAAIGSWVTPGTPSMSLRSAMPCQWTLVSSGSRLSTATRSRSPAVARISGPGTLSSYAQVDTVRPPRSIWVGCGVNRAVTRL